MCLKNAKKRINFWRFLNTFLTIGPKPLYLQKSLFYRKVLEFLPGHTEKKFCNSNDPNTKVWFSRSDAVRLFHRNMFWDPWAKGFPKMCLIWLGIFFVRLPFWPRSVLGFQEEMFWQRKWGGPGFTPVKKSSFYQPVFGECMEDLILKKIML